MLNKNNKYYPYLLLAIVGVLLLGACSPGRPKVVELKENGLTLQLLKMPVDPGENKEINYSVRLIPEKALLESKDQLAKTALWYRMDSCFYVMAGQKKVYASIVQPIANGVMGRFEYLLSFEISDLETANWHMVYQDKYLNQKKYTMNLHQ